MGSNRKSPELAAGGLLKGVVATSIVPFHLTLSLSLCLAGHIRFYAELSWECSAKSVSISRAPKLLSLTQAFDDCPRNVFWARKGDRGSQWSSWLRGTELWTTRWHTELSEKQLGFDAALLVPFTLHWKDLKWFNGYTTLKATSDFWVSEVRFANPCCLDLSFHCHTMIEGLRKTQEQTKSFT